MPDVVAVLMRMLQYLPPERSQVDLWHLERRARTEFGGKRFYILTNESIARRKRREAASTTKVR